MLAPESSVFQFKLDKKIEKFKMQNKNGKTVQSEPLRSISNILQSAVYLCCPSCPLQLSCLVRRFNSISQNRKNIFFVFLGVSSFFLKNAVMLPLPRGSFASKWISPLWKQMRLIYFISWTNTWISTKTIQKIVQQGWSRKSTPRVSASFWWTPVKETVSSKVTKCAFLWFSTRFAANCGKGKKHFQLLLGKFPEIYKARWFAGLNRPN